MGRPAKSGIKVVKRKLHDGTTREYFYDRATGHALGSDRQKAMEAARSERVQRGADPDSFAHLIIRFLERPEFRQTLAPRTQKLYRGYLDLMRTEWGHMPFRRFDVSAIEQIKAAYQDQPRKCNQILALFRILLGYAVKLRWMRDNPALRPEMLPTRPRTQVWSYEDEDAFLKPAGASLRLGLMLLIYTLQRPSDVLAMTMRHVTEHDGRLWLLLRQQKTGELVELPAHERLEPLLRERVAGDGMLLVPSPTGLPWAYRNFARAWDSVREKAGIEDRQRRDARRTGVVRMAEAGATVPQIAAVTGWGIDYCQRIVDTYLPRRTEVARSGIEAWERAGRTESRVVQLGLHRRK